MKLKVFLAVLAALVAIVATLVVHNADVDTSPELGALRADPMASAEFQHTTLVNVSSHPGGTAMGKPSSARLFRTFEFDGKRTLRAILDEFHKKALASGWTDWLADDECVLMEKDLDPDDGTGRITADVSMCLSSYFDPSGGS